ncbi:hypothetical protein PGTUg99_007399 [Puccinia graminis f. sp. tritici]|uniref:Uncharacterized protein n=1 Tax=Puccinia graminis f. sp. tritici TaxID=56615 RepID=A0A5B0SHZ5_PUCGR|nr:hypothetical protein PGTUg99_007399 [Puccinia graminis f. sp. tritici]
MTVKAAKPLSTLGSPRTSVSAKPKPVTIEESTGFSKLLTKIVKDPLAGSQSSNSTEQPEQLPILIHNRKIASMPVQISQPL